MTTKMVRVACMVPNGISLRLFKRGYDDGTGFRPMVSDGPSIFLPGPSTLHTGVGNTGAVGAEPVLTEVEPEWWAAWLDQNKENPLVTMEQIYALPEDEEKPTP